MQVGFESPCAMFMRFISSVAIARAFFVEMTIAMWLRYFDRLNNHTSATAHSSKKTSRYILLHCVMQNTRGDVALIKDRAMKSVKVCRRKWCVLWE